MELALAMLSRGGPCAYCQGGYGRFFRNSRDNAQTRCGRVFAGAVYRCSCSFSHGQESREGAAHCSFVTRLPPIVGNEFRRKCTHPLFFRLPIGSHHGIALRSDSIAFDTSTGLQAGGAAGKNADTSDDRTLEKLGRASGWGKVPPHAIRGRVRAQRRVPDGTSGRAA